MTDAGVDTERLMTGIQSIGSLARGFSRSCFCITVSVRQSWISIWRQTG